MDLTLILAQILGITGTILGLAVIMNKRHETTIIEELVKNKGALWFFGFVTLVLGTTVAVLSSAWSSGNTGLLITIIGWLGIIKGAYIVLFPESTASFYGKFAKGNTLVVGGFIAFLIGLLLIYKGFM